MANYEPSNARDLINRFIDTIGARDETGVVPFVQAWPRIVGRDKAAHSQVLDVKNGTVLVGVDHPAWLQRMHMDRRRIIAAIQRQFPSLKAKNLAFTIVHELSHSWDGDTGQDNGDQHPSTDASATKPAPEKPDPGGTSLAYHAAEDRDFQRHLEGLRRALEEKERDKDR